MKGFPILLVEDDENDALFFELAARKASIPHPVHVAKDGQEAIDYLRGQGAFADRRQYPSPGVIVLDLNLPRKNGLLVLEWLRGASEMKRVPVIVLTSSSNEQDIEEAYELGANSYLIKPSCPEELEGIVQAIKLYWLGYNQLPPSCAKSINHNCRPPSGKSKQLV